MRKFPGVAEDEWVNFYILGTTFTALATGTGVAYTPRTINIDSDTDFLFARTNHWMSQDSVPVDVYIKYKDDVSGRYLQKNATLLRMLSGKAQVLDNSGSYDFRAMNWKAPYRISSNASFTIEAANAHAVISPNLYLSFHGGKIYKGAAPYDRFVLRKMPFVYPLERSLSTLPEGVVRISANGSMQTSISIDKDAMFLTKAISGSSTGECTIQVTEGGRDAAWMNQAIHFRTFAGSGAVPNVLPFPRLTGRSKTLSITFTDLSGAQNDISLAFIGEKLFTKMEA